MPCTWPNPASPTTRMGPATPRHRLLLERTFRLSRSLIAKHKAPLLSEPLKPQTQTEAHPLPERVLQARSHQALSGKNAGSTEPHRDTTQTRSQLLGGEQRYRIMRTAIVGQFRFGEGCCPSAPVNQYCS